MRFQRDLSRHRSIGVVALLLSVVLVAQPASAEVRGADIIGGRAISADPAIMALAPDVVTPSAILETSDGQVLWARDDDAERAMASTTKIMTAIVVLDSVDDLDELAIVPSEATRVGEAGVGLQLAQTLSVRQLLEAMLVHSGNDAAITLAVHVGGTVDGFVKLMNEKASGLSLTHTRFTNPHGLDEAGHHTTARDLATMAQYAMANPVFREMVGKRSTVVQAGGTLKRFDTSNKLLGSYEGATGVKTGWTDEAGYCLVASAERGGIELFVVVLGTSSENARFVQSKRLLDWGFAHYSERAVTSVNETAALVAVNDYLDVSVPAIVAETTSTPVFDLLGEVTSRTSVVPDVAAPVAKGQRLGTLTIEQGGALIAQVPIVAAADVAAPGAWERFTIGVTRLWRRVFGGQLQAVPVTVM